MANHLRTMDSVYDPEVQTLMYCKHCVVSPMTNICFYSTFGFDIEYTCLNKKTGFKRCPWNGKPWESPSGWMKTDTLLKLPGEINENFPPGF